MQYNVHDGQQHRLKLEINPVFRDLIEHNSLPRGPTYPLLPVTDHRRRKRPGAHLTKDSTDDAIDLSLDKRRQCNEDTKDTKLIAYGPFSSTDSEGSDEMSKSDTAISKTKLVCSVSYLRRCLCLHRS